MSWLGVILYARMWIEIRLQRSEYLGGCVILYARMWIEMSRQPPDTVMSLRHPLCEDVD